MIGALYNGVSGVTSFSKGINVTANNIANVNTVGYQADSMSFARTMYDSIATGTGQIGNGVGTMQVEKEFNQGQVKQSSTYYDFAIEGKGFFVVNNTKNDDTFYARAGNFQKSLDGFMEDKNGFRVQGVATDVLSTTSTNGDTMFTDSYTEYISSKMIGNADFTISINARAKDYTESATEIGTSGNHYKTKGTLLADIDLLMVNYNNKLSQYAAEPNATSVDSTNQNVQLTFDALDTDLDREGKFIQIQIGNATYIQNFDTDANTTMNALANKISGLAGYSAAFDETTKTLSVDNLVPGENSSIYVPLGDYTAPIITETTAIEGSGLGLVNSARDALKDRIELANGEFLEIQNTIPAPNQASVTLEDLDLKLSSLGFSDNNDTEFEATDDGVLLLKQLGNTYVVGRLSTVYFPDPVSLNPTGANLYEETKESGAPKNADLINTVHSKFIETSNSSLSEGFTEIVYTQRAFEASSKAITTADEFLKTAINLKR